MWWIIKKRFVICVKKFLEGIYPRYLPTPYTHPADVRLGGVSPSSADGFREYLHGVTQLQNNQQ